ncbi:MAG: hypothetical protein K1X74_05460 [Pirellulales bacterium]|nr:hypothetical protein [Pirellulales bacterium]
MTARLLHLLANRFLRGVLAGPALWFALAATGLGMAPGQDQTPAKPGAPPTNQPAPPKPPIKLPGAVVRPGTPEKKPPRPAEFADWTPDDFRNEQAEGGNKFAAAVAFLAASKPGDAEVAALLIDLLTFKEPPAPEAPSGNEQEQKRAADARQRDIDNARRRSASSMKPLLQALAANGSDPAFAAIQQVLAGSLDTGAEDKQAAPTALEALMAMAHPGVDALLLASITQPQTIRTPERTTWTADDLQKLALRLVAQRTSPELRAQLAAFAAKRTTPEEIQRTLQSMLVQNRPENLKAQVAMYLEPGTADALRAQLLKQFTTYSAAACDELLGLPAGTDSASGSGGRTPSAPAASSAVPAAPALDATALTVRDLWTPAFLEAVQAEVAAIESLDQGMPIFALALSLPVDVIRKQVHDKLQSDWRGAAEKTALPAQLVGLIHDPGMLLTIKLTPRKDDPAVRAKRRGQPNGTPQQAARPRTRPTPAADRQAKEDKAMYAWMDASERLIVAINARLQAAAKLRALAAEVQAEAADAAPDAPAAPAAADDKNADANGAASADSGGSAANSPDRPEDDPFGNQDTNAAQRGNLPVKLHPGAKVAAEFHVVWPDDAAARVPDAPVGGMVLHYVRIEELGQLLKLNAYYQKELKKSNNRYLELEGRWLDAIRPDTRAGWQQSVDIFFTRPGAKEEPPGDRPKRRSNEPENLVIEILSISRPE